MPKRVITDEILEQVQKLAPHNSPQQIANILGLKVQTLYSHLYENRIHCNSGYVHSGRFARSRKDAQEGMFNVHERENWLA
jgi:predicted transcriptional regulator